MEDAAVIAFTKLSRTAGVFGDSKPLIRTAILSGVALPFMEVFAMLKTVIV